MQNYYGVYQNKMSREKINIDQFNKLKLLVGTIEKAENFPEAKKSAYKLYINFGSYGKKWSSAQITENYKIDELNGMQIIAAVNLGNKKMWRKHQSEELKTYLIVFFIVILAS